MSVRLQKLVGLIVLFVVAITFSGCLSSIAKSIGESSNGFDSDDILLMRRTRYSAKIINQLKTTKTVFFYKKDKSQKNDSIKAAISSVWNFTPIIFDDIENFEKYASDPNYSYFDIEGVSTTSSGSTGAYSFVHYYLALRLFQNVGRKGKINTLGLCRIELYPKTSTLMAGAGYHSKPEEVINKLYTSGTFYNWTPILLKAHIAAVQNDLNNSIRPWLFHEIKDTLLSEILSKDTLYVPKGLLMSFGSFTGVEKNDKESVFAKYTHPYRICNDKELYQIFEVEKRGKLLFEYTKSCTDKFVSIYNLKENKIIYKKYTHSSYNLKTRDITVLK